MRNLKTYGDIFGGGGGATIGAMAAGLKPLWSIEYDADIAAVQRDNLGDHVIVASVLDVDPAELPPVDVLHMSPPCPNFSVAKTCAKETENDLALARKCAEFIRVIRPKYITLENVYGYRKSYSIMVIWYTMLELGYGVDAWHCNFADYGVPQSRRRLIVTAQRNGKRPPRALPTHSKTPSLFTPAYIGWYEAIADLIPTLPESQFAPWQLDRLPDELRETVLVMTGNTNRNGVDNAKGRGVCSIQQPSNTIYAGAGGGLPRAFLMHGTNANQPTVQRICEPSRTVVATSIAKSSPPRAFVVANGKYGDRLTLQHGDKPHGTVTSNSNQGSLKAFIMQGGNASSARAHETVEPSPTVGDAQRVGNISRAFIVNGTPNDNGTSVTVNDAAAPVFTQTASQHKRPSRAFASGRVVKMTPRALARFQTFPDWYELPDKTSLACRIIGNAVPPLGYQRILEGLL